jgi:hypothetical protein
LPDERIEIRPIRPDDREALADGVRRMSDESRYRRAAARGLLRMRLPHRG